MKIKNMLWMAPLTFCFAIGASGVGFAQSVRGNNPAGGYAENARNAPAGVLIAAVTGNEAPPQADTAADAPEVTPAPELAEPPAEPAQRAAGRVSHSRFGIGVNLSSLGAGVELAVPLGKKFNVRGGFDFFRYSGTFTNDGIHYDGQLRLLSGQAHLDWFPISIFHVSPGALFYDGNGVRANATVPGGQSFSVGGTPYQSDPAAPVTAVGRLDFLKVAPMITVGIGNLVPRSGKHFSFLFEIGGAYQGSARVALNLAGNVCDSSGLNCRAIAGDSTVQSNIQAQQVKIQNDVNPYRFYPVVTVGVGFSF
jgi:hypothetical protein